MIDFLSDVAWIRPQIDFLLILQNIRISHSDIFDRFFLSITVFGEFWLPTLACAIVYWCIDFKKGLYLFTLEGVSLFVTHLFKMLACVYRPWVLDGRVHPSKLAVPFAKGYSFPSGHSAMSSSVFGGIAYVWKNNKALFFSLIFLVLIIGFSRLWLGVHTPQDVVCGLLTGFSLVLIIPYLLNWAEHNNNRYLYLLAGINVFVILTLLYLVYVNTYRMDYYKDELLVDPLGLKYYTSVVYAYSLGLINGAFLCRRFFAYNPKETPIKARIIRGIIGGVAIIIFHKLVFIHAVMKMIDVKLAMSLMFVLGFFITFIYPVIFTKLKNM